MGDVTRLPAAVSRCRRASLQFAAVIAAGVSLFSQTPLRQATDPNLPFNLAPPTPESLALSADWRSFCPFDGLALPVTHICDLAHPAESHPECAANGNLENGELSSSPILRRLAVMGWGRLREGNLPPLPVDAAGRITLPTDAAGRVQPPSGSQRTDRAVEQAIVAGITVLFGVVHVPQLLFDPAPIVRREAANALGLQASGRIEDPIYQLGAPARRRSPEDLARGAAAVRDTADMRLFFDLMPQPDFDFVYTVFARAYPPQGVQVPDGAEASELAGPWMPGGGFSLNELLEGGKIAVVAFPKTCPQTSGGS